MRFVLQSQTIEVINVDNKKQSKDWKRNAQAWKHVADFYTWYYLQSNCDKRGAGKFTGKSTWFIRFENVYVYSKSLQQLKYRYLENLLASIEEIAYFIFFNNSEVVSSNETLPNSIFIFDDITCDKQDTIREYFAMDWHADVDCFYLCQTYAKIPKHLIMIMQISCIILFKQDGTNLKHDIHI